MTSERLRQLLDAIRDYAIVLLDAGGVVTGWEAGAARITGYAADEIVGTHFSRLYPEEDVVAGKPERELEVARAEGRFEDAGWRVRRDGTPFWANTIITPIRVGGEVVGFTKITRDRTAERAIEERLRESEQGLRLLVESVRDYAIYTLDTSGRVTSWNVGAERLKGYTAAEAIGLDLSRFFPPEEVEAGKPRALLASAAETGRSEDEGWRVRKDGTRFWADAIVTAMHDPSGALVGFAKVTRDLTESRRAEQERIRLAQAQEAVRLRDEFLSIAAHELRTPLAALMLRLQNTAHAGKGTGPEATARVASAIEKSLAVGRRLSALVDALLDASRVLAGRLSLNREPTDLAEVAREVADDFAATAQAAGCTVRLALGPDARGEWDRFRLQQVLTNLLSNAIKYGAGEPIDVRVETDGSVARLVVADRGIGIEPAEVERIFERFHRAGAAQSYSGLGLGLYITREIVRSHGGTIRAAPRAGGGAEFTVELPLSAS